MWISHREIPWPAPPALARGRAAGPARTSGLRTLWRSMMTELALLADSGTAMAHCPQANARLGSGIAPADRLYAQRRNGVDRRRRCRRQRSGRHGHGASTPPLRSIAQPKGAAATRAETVLHWATEGGARALGFDGIGRIAPGRPADIAIFDLSHPRNMGLHDPALAPVITGAATVRHSFVGGAQIVADGRIPWLDLAEPRRRRRPHHRAIAGKTASRPSLTLITRSRSCQRQGVVIAPRSPARRDPWTPT